MTKVARRTPEPGITSGPKIILPAWYRLRVQRLRAHVLRLRATAGVLQQEVAAAAGVETTTASALLSGKRYYPLALEALERAVVEIERVVKGGAPEDADA